MCERMAGIGGLNRKKANRKRCGICWKAFEENESKVQRVGEKFFRCTRCDGLGESEKKK